MTRSPSGSVLAGLAPEQTAEAKSRRLDRAENLFRIGVDGAVSARGNVGDETAAQERQQPPDRHGHGCPPAPAVQHSGGADMTVALNR